MLYSYKCQQAVDRNHRGTRHKNILPTNEMRTPRKKIRVSKAAEIFSIGKQTFINRCRKGIYRIQLLEQDQPGSTEPLMVFEAAVLTEAKQRGLI